MIVDHKYVFFEFVWKRRRWNPETGAVEEKYFINETWREILLLIFGYDSSFLKYIF